MTGNPVGTAAATALYAAAAKIYPRHVWGNYQRLRTIAMAVLLGLFYVLPWIEVNGTPLVLFDLPHRRFHVFGMTLVPQDLYLLTFLLLIAALTLFFFTALAGRLWCGYACPQTVWTEAFLWIEHFTEGDRHARMKLDHAPWGLEKVLRKGGKHVLWLALGLYTGLSFVAYFVPARQMFPAALQLELSGWPLFWSLFYGFATWGNAGFMREQVCKYMCPYARFQSAMFDRDTLIISYDRQRGEPRKSLAKQSGQATGDCVACNICVQVCPVGIDIRNGLQYECIACAACVDACDDVMDAVDKPRNLIRYTTASQEAGSSMRLLRPRVIAYGALWSTLCAGFLVLLLLRSSLELDVIRDRHSLYRQIDDDVVENLYTLKLTNKGTVAHPFTLSIAASDGIRFTATPDRFTLAAGEASSVTVSVRNIVDDSEDENEGDKIHGIHQLEFTLAADDNPSLTRRRKASFIAGGD